MGADRDTDPNRSVHLAAADMLVDAIREDSQAQRFPLDAEQIVRLTGTVLAQVLNAVRHPDAKPIAAAPMILALGDAVGLPLPVEETNWGGQVLLDYGATAQPKRESPEQPAGGSREG